MFDAFPRWTAPLLGALLGAFFGYKADPGVASPIYVGGGALLGLLAGCLVFLLDSKPGQGGSFETGLNSNPENDQIEYLNDTGLVGRFLALVACLLCVIPFAGPVIGLIATFVNWRAGDSAGKASRIATGIAGCVTLVVILTIIF